MNSFAKHLVAVAALTTFSAFAAPITGASGPSAPPLPGVTTVVDFDAQGNQSVASFAVGGITFSGVGGNIRTDNQFAGQYNGRGTHYVDNAAGQTNALRFDFSSIVSAFAFQWGASDVSWTLSGFDAGGNLIESFVTPITYGSNAGEYIGLSGGAYKYATLTTSNASFQDWIFVDNFSIVGERTAEVSEPAGLALAGLALLGLGALRRRKA